MSEKGTEEKAGKLGCFGVGFFLLLGFLVFLLSELCKKKLKATAR